jgi:hypothetical protein
MGLPPPVAELLRTGGPWDAYFAARGAHHRSLAAGMLAKRLPPGREVTHDLVQDAASLVAMAEWEMVLGAGEGDQPEDWNRRLKDKASARIRTLVAQQVAPMSGAEGAARRNARARAADPSGAVRGAGGADGRADPRAFVPLDAAHTAGRPSGIDGAPDGDVYAQVDDAAAMARFAQAVAYRCLGVSADCAWVADLMLAPYTDPDGRDMSAQDVAAATGFSVRTAQRLMREVRRQVRQTLAEQNERT